MISTILAYLLPFKYRVYSPSSFFLSARVMHMIVVVTGVPPEHIRQGAEVVFGETPAKMAVIGVPPAFAIDVAWSQFLSR